MPSSNRKLVQSSSHKHGPDFERYKSELRDLYVVQGKSRVLVSQLMEKNHGFHASKHHYERAFEKWGWSKNMSSHIWNALCPHLHHLQALDQDFDVFHYGEKVDKQKVFREMRKRPSATVSALPPLQPNALDGVAVVPSPIPSDSRLRQGLPFEEFERRARISLPVQLSITNSDMSSNITSDGSLDVLSPPSSNYASNRGLSQISKNLEREAFDFTRSRLSRWMAPPSSMSLCQSDPSEPSPIDLGTCLCTSTIHRDFLFRVANNLAGVHKLDHQLIRTFLENAATQHVSQLFRIASDTYTMRAVVFNLFRVAVRTGHATTVRYFLGQNSVEVYQNCLIDVPGRGHLTPIEVAAAARHAEMVKIFVDHEMKLGNHVRARASHFQRALDCMFDMHIHNGHIRQSATPSAEVARILIMAGARLTKKSIDRIWDAQAIGILVKVFITCASIVSDEWLQNGTFFQVIWHCDTYMSCQMIETLFSIRGQIRDCTITKKSGTEQFNLADIAARKGSLELLKLLFSRDVQPTEHTLSLAVASGNEAIVHLVVLNSDVQNWTNQFVIKLISQAIECGEIARSIFELVVESGALQRLIGNPCTLASWKSATRQGTAWMIELLLQHGVELNEHSLYICLTNTIQEDLDAAACLLIDLGVPLYLDQAASLSNSAFEVALDVLCTTGQDQLESPFVTALRRRNLHMMRYLLDAGLPLEHALDLDRLWGELLVKWGDRAAVQLLLDAGVDKERLRCLLATAAESDISLTKFLCDNAVCPNHYRNLLDHQNGPLVFAAQCGNYEACQVLLDHGADPYDEIAFIEAARDNVAISYLILECYKARYSTSRTGFDVVALEVLIELGNFATFASFVDCRFGSKPIAGPPASFFLTQPLAHATVIARDGDTRYVEKLLQLGCNPEQTTRFPSPRGLSERITHYTREWRGLTTSAFLLAVISGNSELIKIFLRYGAHVNSPARFGVARTALQAAAEYGCAAIVQLLINSGADVNGAPAHTGGGTALQLAALKGHSDIVVLLLRYGAGVDAAPSKVHGRTALEGAAEHGRLDIAKILLNAGAAQGGTNLKSMNNAITYAKENGHPYIADMLQDHLDKNMQLPQLDTSDMLDATQEFFDWSRWDETTMEVEHTQPN